LSDTVRALKRRYPGL